MLATSVSAGACFAPASAPDFAPATGTVASAVGADSHADETLVLPAADCGVAPEVAAVDR